MSDPFASSWLDDVDDPSWTFDSADYELLWPRELLVRELAAVNRSRSSSDRRAWIERLLEEAFLGTVPVEDFKASRGQTGEYVKELISQAPRLREHHAPAAYWSARRGTIRRRPERSLDQLHHDFARLIATVQADGYLEQAFPRCAWTTRSGSPPTQRRCSPSASAWKACGRCVLPCGTTRTSSST